MQQQVHESESEMVLVSTVSQYPSCGQDIRRVTTPGSDPGKIVNTPFLQVFPCHSAPPRFLFQARLMHFSMTYETSGTSRVCIDIIHSFVRKLPTLVELDIMANYFRLSHCSAAPAADHHDDVLAKYILITVIYILPGVSCLRKPKKFFPNLLCWQDHAIQASP